MAGLHDKRIVITRAAAQAAESGAALAARGGVPIYLPILQAEPVADPGLLDNELRAMQTYDWVVFPSLNAVRAVVERFTAMRLSVEALRGPQVAAMGPATAGALTELGVEPALLPDEARATGLIEALGEVRGQRILVPQSSLARPELVEGLRAAGATVTAVTAYRSGIVTPEPAAVAEVRRGVDAVTFASPSAVDGWVAFELPEPPLVACIGPTTANAARALSFEVAVTAPHPHTWAALLDALEKYWAG